MPIQHTLFGSPIALAMPPRRFQIVFGVLLLFTTAIVFLGTPQSVESGVSTLSDTVSTATSRLPTLPKVPVSNPFRATHKPPVQANSTAGDVSWFSDWKWKNPLSSQITLDESRTILPPLKTRPPIYTFYDPPPKQNAAVRDAEHKLLLMWRRAWWAQGFRPVVLGRAEAQENPLYRSSQRPGINEPMEKDVVRWLAWSHMGGGILANWLAFPMAAYDDPLLSFLRRGEYPKLTRYEGLDSSLFCGDKAAITAAVTDALKSPSIGQASSVVDTVSRDTFSIDPKHDSIAYYSRQTINDKFGQVALKLTAQTESEGLALLSELINSHLQTTWQNTFHSGIAVLKPMSTHSTALIDPAISIARSLSFCAPSPMPNSCPPNRPKCTVCTSSNVLDITTPDTYKNSSSSTFTIGVVPHPYTSTTLNHQLDDLTPRFLRRQGLSSRDQWVFAATKDLLGTSVSGAARVLALKDAIASEWGQAHTLWLTAESESQKDLDWHFGFSIPENQTAGPKQLADAPSAQELEKERELIKKAREAIRSKVREMVKRREAVEQWNLVDAEAWRFARAWSARRRVQRRKWRDEEKRFAGAEQRNRWWGGWFEKEDDEEDQGFTCLLGCV